MTKICANLPSRDFDVTVSFYTALGFAQVYRGDQWLIMTYDAQWIEFFPHPELIPKGSWFSACLRVNDIDAQYARFASTKLAQDPASGLRLSKPENIGNGLRMFAFTDSDGSLWRCIQSETRNEL